MYLISTQGLIDLIGGDPDIGQLLRQLGADRVRVSIAIRSLIRARMSPLMRRQSATVGVRPCGSLASSA